MYSVTWWFCIKAFDVLQVSVHGLLQVAMDHTPAVVVPRAQHNSRDDYYYPPTHGDDKTYDCQRRNWGGWE